MPTNHFDELQHPTHATKYLANRLTDGSLVLFLGAGASKGFGLLNWQELVDRLRGDLGLTPVKSTPTAEDLQRAADEVCRKITTAELIDRIEKLLYPVDHQPGLTEVFDNHLLNALSGLLMGSKRGHVTRVVTLNYDSMLEWYLSLFGFVVKTIHTLPAMEGAEDIRIYHPHGYIPNPQHFSEKSDFVMLGMDHANMRLGRPHDPWFEMVRHILDSGLGLFIGLSHNTLMDRAIAPLFSQCGNACRAERPLGVWLLLQEQVGDAEKSDFQASNIVPVAIPTAEKVSEFILGICQEAAKKLFTN